MGVISVIGVVIMLIGFAAGTLFFWFDIAAGVLCAIPWGIAGWLGYRWLIAPRALRLLYWHDDQPRQLHTSISTRRHPTELISSLGILNWRALHGRST